ncbi:hypothetical protein INR49_012787 [Caranx melampygus]|nr:hypothetical protein INR49_012787 [Caranx melampygus]
MRRMDDRRTNWRGLVLCCWLLEQLRMKSIIPERPSTAAEHRHQTQSEDPASTTATP